MSLLRIFWTIFSFILTVLLFAKFALAAWMVSVSAVLPAAVGVLLFFYLLFQLEGLQVSGLQIKDLQTDAIEQFLSNNPVASEGKVLPMHEIFSTKFDGFVCGRQVFTIMTVVAISFLINSVKIPIGAFQDKFAMSISEPGFMKVFFNILTGGFFAFASATLVPAWWCQLLSQYIADGRALTFAGFPFARFVLRIAMLLDKLQVGQPAHVMLKILTRLGLIGERQPIQIGKRAYYEASVGFYGHARERHDIYLTLGKPTTVKEKITYVFKRGVHEKIYHNIELSKPIIGDIRIKLDLPENTFGTVSVQDVSSEESCTYFIKIGFSKPIRPDTEVEVVIVSLEYQTQSYSDDVGIQYTTLFSSPLPVENAAIHLQSDNKLLKEPKVSIVEEVDGQLWTVTNDENSQIWEISSLENYEKKIDIFYPMVATCYQIKFETIDVDPGPRV